MTNYANNAANNYADSQTVMGDTMASFNEKIAPNFGYGFGDQAKYNNAEDGAQARFVASLEAQLKPELVDRLRASSKKVD